MARDEHPPFERGSTFYNGGTIDANDLGGVNLEGKEYVVNDDIYGTGLQVKLRVVRNVSGINLLPKRLVGFKSGFLGRRVDGYADVTNEYSFPVDELLPPGGVPNNDLFYVVVEGPAAILTTDAGNAVSEGEVVVASTAANSTGATAGRVAAAAATITGKDAANKVGRAMSAVTAGQTAYSLLVGVGW